MQIDKRTLSCLLAMNDTQLASVIEHVAREAGIDPSNLGLDATNVESIRAALGSATDKDLEQLNTLYRDYQRHKH